MLSVVVARAQIAGRSEWSAVIVVMPPCIQNELHTVQRDKPALAQTLIAQPRVEGLDHPVLGGTARTDEVELRLGCLMDVLPPVTWVPGSKSTYSRARISEAGSLFRGARSWGHHFRPPVALFVGTPATCRMQKSSLQYRMASPGAPSIV